MFIISVSILTEPDTGTWQHRLARLTTMVEESLSTAGALLATPIRKLRDGFAAEPWEIAELERNAAMAAGRSWPARRA
jgi:ATP-binding cassette subfamily B protein